MDVVFFAEVSDEELAVQVQQGSQTALAMLFERHYARLLGYLYRLCGGSGAVAEDLVQETFLRALRGIALYQYPRPFKAWLYAIATNLARNHYARADTRHTENPPETAEYADPAPLPEEAFLQQDTAQRVLAALQTLPAHQREVVILFYYQELAQAEIAEALHIPVGTVKSRLSIGMKRLREILQDR
jgi:RNA polymerase sigma-70 factor (ECF subfamily)